MVYHGVIRGKGFQGWVMINVFDNLKSSSFDMQKEAERALTMDYLSNILKIVLNIDR